MEETGIAHMNNWEIPSEIRGAEYICSRALRLIPVGTIDLEIVSVIV